MNRLKGFENFIREQGVVGLAVGFMLGGAVSDLVKSFTQDIVNPIIGAVFGSIDQLSDVMLGPVLLGHFLTVMIDFFIIAAVVYFGFKALGLERFDKKAQ